jgi:hypothetical protein
MTLTEFYKEADIRFFDHVTVPRRSLAPTSSAPRTRRRSSTGGAGAPVLGLAEAYLATAVHVPALEVLGAAARQAQDRVDALGAEFTQAEADARRMPPTVFDDWELGTEEDRQELTVRPARYAPRASLTRCAANTPDAQDERTRDGERALVREPARLDGDGASGG